MKEIEGFPLEFGEMSCIVEFSEHLLLAKTKPLTVSYFEPNLSTPGTTWNRA